jgi:hypothetical protein
MRMKIEEAAKLVGGKSRADASPLGSGTGALVRIDSARAASSSTADLGSTRRPGRRWWHREGGAVRACGGGAEETGGEGGAGGEWIG